MDCSCHPSAFTTNLRLTFRGYYTQDGKTHISYIYTWNIAINDYCQQLNKMLYYLCKKKVEVGLFLLVYFLLFNLPEDLKICWARLEHLVKQKCSLRQTMRQSESFLCLSKVDINQMKGLRKTVHLPWLMSILFMEAEIVLVSKLIKTSLSISADM